MRSSFRSSPRGRSRLVRATVGATLAVGLLAGIPATAQAATPSYPSDSNKPDLVTLLDGFSDFWQSDGVNDLHGTVKDPQKTADAMMKSLRDDPDKDDKDSKTEFLGQPQTLHPSGAEDAVVECQTAKITDISSGKAYTLSVCLWADYSTVGTVAPFDLTVLTNGTGTGMSAADTADLLAKVRKDVRVPLAG